MSNNQHAEYKSSYPFVSDAITTGKIVYFLGAGVNLCSRQPGMGWQPGINLPSGSELTMYLAEGYKYPRNKTKVYCRKCKKWEDLSGIKLHLNCTHLLCSYKEEIHPSEKQFLCSSCASEVEFYEQPQDLLRVAQYVRLGGGRPILKDKLDSVFKVNPLPTMLHEFFATLPDILCKKGVSNRFPLIVTTNYDDMIERAFINKGEPFDLVYYKKASNERTGKFWHRSHNGTEEVIKRPNSYTDLPFNKRTVIIKIHGTIDRTDETQDNYVITEEDYIEYLADLSLENVFPGQLLNSLRQNHILFLGYSLRDWNLRVILHRLFRQIPRNSRNISWAIQLQPEETDKLFWEKYEIKILDSTLEQYLKGLRAQLCQ